MLNDNSTVKITLEINQETNLDELMAHLCLMQDNIPDQNSSSGSLEFLSDFSIHEGELEPAEVELDFSRILGA